MFCWSKACLLLVFCAAAHAHVVSISNGELHVTGSTGAFELRIPVYEAEGVASPETTLLNELQFQGAKRIASSCRRDADWLTCQASYEFSEPPVDAIQVECTLYRVTVPNHIHLFYAVRGDNSDQVVFDQNTPSRELRFHPPTLWESLARDATAGALRLLKSPAGLLFLVVVALTARSRRDAILLATGFLFAEWTVRPLSPFFPFALSPEFLEALLALTVAYLAGELLLLPTASSRWIIVPLLGLIHGLPFAAFPKLYMAGAAALQLVLLALLSCASLRIPEHWRKPTVAVAFTAAGAWFARLVLGT